MRLIDADALRAQFDEIPQFIGMTGGCVQQYIDKAPTIEAKPVVHGEWVYNEEYVLWEEKYVCSICGRNALTDGDYRPVMSDYCPNCGAAMRERKDKDV